MLERVALVLGGLLLVLSVVIASRLGHLHVERSMPVPVAPQVVHNLVNDFHAWPSWSPWEKLDPGMTRELSGATRGLGAQYAWSGNDEVGRGSMEIIESAPEQIKIRLVFEEPFAATNTITFSLAPLASSAGAAGTRVTWAMDGEQGFASKAMGLFMDMDALIGKDFEVGLANLGALAVGVAEAQGTPAKVEPVPVPVVPAAAGGSAAAGE